MQSTYILLCLLVYYKYTYLYIELVREYAHNEYISTHVDDRYGQLSIAHFNIF